MIEATSVWPRFVAAGDMLTDLIRTHDASWLARPGGAGWNVARAVARLGTPSACAGALGRDYFSDTLWHASAAAGLDLRFLQRNQHAPLLAVVQQTHPPDYFFLGENSADLAFDPTQLPAGWITHVQWVHFGCISLVREPLATTLLTLATKLHTHGVKLCFDPNYRNLMTPQYRPMLQKMAALADLIKVSDEDLRHLFGDNEADAIALLRSWNPAAALFVTRGGNTATLYTDDEIAEAQPPAIAIADTVGAGDASLGALLYSLMASPWQSSPAHLAFALAAGAAACRQAGAHAPSIEEINALLPPSTMLKQ